MADATVTLPETDWRSILSLLQWAEQQDDIDDEAVLREISSIRDSVAQQTSV